MFLRTWQGPKIRAEAGTGPNTAPHTRGNGKQAKTRNPGPGTTTLPPRKQKASKARNPGPGPHIAKGPA